MSWYQYLDVLKERAYEFNYYATVAPWACPRCGEPLMPGPASAENTIFCKFDGWAYPEDYVQPLPG